jgi:uncharacterized protein
MVSKLVLVSGASSGIGEATAKRYGRNGAHVLLLARNVTRLDEVADAIRREGGGATVYRVDLSDAAAIAEVSARITREAGTPDILINNAGAGRWLPLLDTMPEDALAMIEVPYLAAFNLTRAFLPAMLARKSGRIACVTSPASYLAWPNASAYIAARQALKGFTEGLRSELHGSGITVTLVVLGTVETPYWQHNPGSGAHVPKTNAMLFPTLTADEAAETIVMGTEARQRLTVRPRAFRLLFALNALMPNLVAAQLRRASRKR